MPLFSKVNQDRRFFVFYTVFVKELIFQKLIIGEYRIFEIERAIIQFSSNANHFIWKVDCFESISKFTFIMLWLSVCYNDTTLNSQIAVHQKMQCLLPSSAFTCLLINFDNFRVYGERLQSEFLWYLLLVVKYYARNYWTLINPLETSKCLMMQQVKFFVFWFISFEQNRDFSIGNNLLLSFTPSMNISFISILQISKRK